MPGPVHESRQGLAPPVRPHIPRAMLGSSGVLASLLQNSTTPLLEIKSHSIAMKTYSEGANELRDLREELNRVTAMMTSTAAISMTTPAGLPGL
eukprot:3256644-Pyramimonas_sp.AAC.1